MFWAIGPQQCSAAQQNTYQTSYSIPYHSLTSTGSSYLPSNVHTCPTPQGPHCTLGLLHHFTPPHTCTHHAAITVLCTHSVLHANATCAAHRCTCIFIFTQHTYVAHFYINTQYIHTHIIREHMPVLVHTHTHTTYVHTHT